MLNRRLFNKFLATVPVALPIGLNWDKQPDKWHTKPVYLRWNHKEKRWQEAPRLMFLQDLQEKI